LIFFAIHHGQWQIFANLNSNLFCVPSSTGFGFFFLLQGIEHQMMKPLPGDLVVNDVSDTSVRCLQDGEEKDTELSSILSL